MHDVSPKEMKEVSGRGHFAKNIYIYIYITATCLNPSLRKSYSSRKLLPGPDWMVKKMHFRAEVQ